MPKKPPEPEPLRLKIDRIVEAAEKSHARIAAELPGHGGLAEVSRQVVLAAKDAERLSVQMRRFWNPHRLPAYFLAATLLLLAGWTYWRFFHVSTLTVALPDRDASALRERIADKLRVSLFPVPVPGSREAAELVDKGKVDLAFVQGGIRIAPDLARLESPSPEIVLLLTRGGNESPLKFRRVLTSLPNEGSHTVAQDFAKLWGTESQTTYVHEWTELSDSSDYKIADDIDAVFVVKDPADESTLRAIERLRAANFSFINLDLGARASKLDYLRPYTLTKGYLSPGVLVPQGDIKTYSVSTFLVARRGLTPRLLSVAAHVFDQKTERIEDNSGANMMDAGEIFQGIDGFLGIIVNIGLAFIALLGLDMLSYRRRFHRLSSLVSLLSMLQSNKDVLGVRDPAKRSEHVLYLRMCSDLCGLISSICGYYTQENSSLLFNNPAEVIPDRCDNLKLNIQIKILHATVDLSSATIEKTA